MLTYLESEDGVHWQRPELSLVPYEKHEKTNILMEPWCSYASVLIHPDREMLDKSGAAIPGYTREDCVPLRGDHRAASVRWKGVAVAPENAVQLRFYLKRAFLYGFVAE